jgi:lipoyl-dependent peroxiredoxin
VTARVGIGPNDSGGYDLAVELHVRLPDLDRDQAEQLARQAHQICPYSNATRGNIDVQIIVEPASDLV